ncbi:hypothetical protein MJO29_008354 [Puccinia striiformis f. sp. tritici]|uniref:Uncharacterized protein n=1 Tax=Puccinia striiformis f. sp. tritici PST-78 TaxID=1165861 RepID=A0A0L0UWM6_9BASI|nr:hypothetical protein Pst134EB_016590 [Puccinia striiformis f. sp. tritici]KAI7952723.1 hypothetical protein MJO29_008354 [Puccinia striiformis f. sp. tritici]KNE91346.1 hypothetical protein PSTG_15211 [Puccinia striiformis f. sp. tritici PST-78]
MSAGTGAGIPTTAEEWSAIQAKIELHARSPYSIKDKRVLWCQGIIVLLSGVLYLISLLRRATLNGIWCFKKDVEGYWHPNVHVAIPIVTIAHAAIQTAGIGLIVIADAPEDKVPTIVALNLTACSMLYYAGWTKVWAVLYALPSSIFRLRRRDVLGSTAMITKRRILSPTIFNRFILGGYLIGVLPIPWLTFTVYWIQKILDQLQLFRITAQHLILNMSSNENPGTSLLLSFKAASEIKHLRKAQEKALQNLRIFSGAWLAISLGALFIFLGGSFALLLALTGQIEILTKIQKQREMLISGSRSDFTAKSSHSPKNLQIHGDETQVPRPSFFSRLKTWIPTLGDDEGDDDLLGMPPTTTPPSYHISRADELGKGVARMSYLYDAGQVNHASRKNYKQLVSYCVRFAWQAVFCTLIATSYIVLNIFVVFNVLDAPRSISLSQLLRTVEQWAAWSWGGGPGAVLGFLACVVAFSKNPILPQEPEKGPPSLEQDDEDEDDDNGARSREHALTTEKLHMHGTRDLGGFPVSPKLPDAALTDTSGIGTWKGIRPKMSFGSNSQVSRSAPSRNQETSSETSAKFSRAQSPFQILSLTNSNFVRSAKPYPLTNLPKSGSHYQPSHLFTSEPQESRVGSPLTFTPSPNSSKTFQLRTQQSYPMPVQVSRSQSTSYDPFVRGAEAQHTRVESMAGRGHFDAIHQLRERE